MVTKTAMRERIEMVNELTLNVFEFRMEHPMLVGD